MALADELVRRGAHCAFLTSPDTVKFIPDLRRFECIASESYWQDPIHASWIVFDAYTIDAATESRFRQHCEKIAVIDDLANRAHDCDLLVDPSIGREANHYHDWAPDSTLLVGTSYGLLRSEFAARRPEALTRRAQVKTVKNILVSIGGCDTHNLTLSALKMIDEVQFCGEVEIVLGFAAPHRDAVFAFAKTMRAHVRIHQQAKMVDLICKADLGIGAAGGSTWERCCLGLPQYLLQAAANQSLIYDHLKFPGSFTDFYSEAQSHYAELAQCCSLISDGLGVSRVLTYIEDVRDKRDRSVRFRRVRQEDCEQVYQWQKMPTVRAFSFNQTSPTLQEHQRWFQKTLKQETTIYEIVVCDSVPCGTLRLDYVNERDCYRLSWYIIPEYWSAGVGTEVVRYATLVANNFPIEAQVLEENIASQRVLQKVGFKQISKGEWKYAT